VSLRALVAVAVLLVAGSAAGQSTSSASPSRAPPEPVDPTGLAPPQPESRWRDDETHFSIALQASFAPRNLYHIPVLAGEAELEVGARVKRSGYYHATVGGLFGATESGLPILSSSST
jgi:hypothetical protein